MKIIRILLGIIVPLGILADKPISYLLIGLYFGILTFAIKTKNQKLVNLLSSKVKIEKTATTKQFIGSVIFSLMFIVVGIIIFLTNGMRLW